MLRRVYKRSFFRRALAYENCEVEFLSQQIPGRGFTHTRYDVRIRKSGPAPEALATLATTEAPPRGRPKDNVEPVTSSNRRLCLCGVRLDALWTSEVLARVEEAVENHTRLAISVVNVAKLVNMRRDAVLRENVESGDLILADGMPLVWLRRLTGTTLPERIAGIDLMFDLFNLAEERALRVFLLGAKSDTLKRVVEVAGQQYPRMVIAGHHHGYFGDAEQEEVARTIRDARPDVLLVAMSSPKKELFMRCWSEFMDVPVCHGVGGSFDVMAGLTRRAPRWVQRAGLEWLYRLLQEPRRLWKRYVVTNAVFVGLAVNELVGLQRMRKD